jgi:arabinofuranosyltransferase
MSHDHSSRPRNPVATGLAVLLLLGGVVWLLLRQRYFSGWVDDDAFISFRYARNLAEGNGLVFNVGERVEGYTNFLWTAILAVAYRLGADLPSAARLLGALFSVATVGALALFSRTSLLRLPDTIPAGLRPFLLLLAPLLLCFFDSWAAWAAGGLENVLSAFLVTSALLAYATYLGNAKRHTLTWAALGFAFAILNHPTNALFALVVAIDVLWRARGASSPRTPSSPSSTFVPLAHLMPAVLLFLAVVGTWTVWRLLYYGDLLPNTFHAKVGFTPYVLRRGLSFMLETLRALPLPYVGTFALGVLLLRRRLAHPLGWILFAAVLLNSSYIIAVGGEQFPALRSTVVLLPLFALILQVCMHTLCVALAPPKRGSGRFTTLVTTLLVVSFIATTLPLYWSPRIRILDEALYLGRTALSTTAALKLKQLLPEDTLFAHSGAGLIAFYTNLPWIDTLGLTDRHIARTPVEDMGRGAAGHEKGDGAYVWSRKPDFIMFPGYPISNRTPGTKGGRELFAIPQFHQAYRSVRLPFDFQGPNDDTPRRYHLYLWQRADGATR